MGIERGAGVEQPSVDNFPVNGAVCALPSADCLPVRGSVPAAVGAGRSGFTLDAVNGAESVAKKKRGRPPKGGGRTKAVVPPTAKRSKKEEEDVCFICFDGGKLVLCDRRDCPKAYHPACVKRDESFFKRRVRWNCGWHLCNICQKNAIFMCYTCPYSLCKTCVKQADISCVRGNKGFCKTCMNTISLIENITQGNQEVGHVDFDDTTSWEYLFKVYWVYLKQKESLTLDELTRATNPWKNPMLNHVNNTSQEFHNTCVDRNVELSSTIGLVDTYNNQADINVTKRRKTRKQLPLQNNSREKVVVDKLQEGVGDWASKELLEFVAHVKNGNTSKLTRFDVQALLSEYIRKNKLCDSRRKCQVICDKRLEILFGKARVDHLEMLKLLEDHFKDGSCANGVVHAAAVDCSPSLMNIEQRSEEVHNERKRPTHKKVDVRERQINMDNYAAIDVHNMRLIYLRRSLAEKLMEDAKSFHDKVVGCIVRIQISGNDLNQEIYRLVRVEGTSKAAEPYKLGDKTADIMLKILNIDRIEDVTVDALSNHDLSEDECRRLRQSIKCGLVERMTVGEVHNKAIALQEVRVTDVLDTEILKLNYLRDQAIEMGHRKELRACVKKLEILKSPEEFQRRICEIPEVHSDPRMDPIFHSDEDPEQSDTKKQDLNMPPKDSNSDSRSPELITSGRVDMPYSTRDKVLQSSFSNWESKRNVSDISKDDGAAQSHDSSQSTLETDAARILEELRNQVDPCRITKREPMTLVDHAQDASYAELEKTWYYQDPSGKVQGPFAMLQLRKWNSNGYFPADLRIWRMDESQDKSVLLSDVLSRQCSNGHHFESDCLESQQTRFVSDCRKADHDRQPDININAVWTGDEPNDGCNSDFKDAVWCPENKKQTINGQNSRQEADPDGVSQFSPKENQKSAHVVSSPGREVSIACPACEDTVSATMDPNHKPECSDLPSPLPKDDHEDSKCLPVEPGRQFSASNVSSHKSGSSPTMPSGRLQSPDLPSSTSKPEQHHEKFEGHTGENKVNDDLQGEPKEDNQPVTPIVLQQNPSSDWKTASGQSNASDLPSQSPELNNEDTKSQAAEVKQSVASFLPGQDPCPSWDALSSGIVFSVPVSSANQNNEGNKGLPAEHCITSNASCQDMGISWTTTTSLVGETVQWVEYSMHAKACVEELDSGIACSGASFKIPDHATTTSVNCQFTHSSSTHPDCSTSGWHDGPIELNTLGDDSVSDLLSEVEAYESLHGVASPNLRIGFGDDSIESPSNDCFSRLVGLGPSLESGKHDAWSSPCDIQFHSQPMVTEPHPTYSVNLQNCHRNPSNPHPPLDGRVKLDFASACTTVPSPVPAVKLVPSGGFGPEDVKSASLPMQSQGVVDSHDHPPTSLSLSGMNSLNHELVRQDYDPEAPSAPIRSRDLTCEVKGGEDPAYVSANKDGSAFTSMPPEPQLSPAPPAAPDTANSMEEAVVAKPELVSHVALPPPPLLPAPPTTRLETSGTIAGEMKLTHVSTSQEQTMAHADVPPPPASPPPPTPPPPPQPPSSPEEEGELEPTSLSLEPSVKVPEAHSPKQPVPRSRASRETSSLEGKGEVEPAAYSMAQQQEPSSPHPRPLLPSPKPISDGAMRTGRAAVKENTGFSASGSTAGNTKPSWGTSHGTAASGHGNTHRSSSYSAANQGNRATQQPRYHGGGVRHSGQKDYRSHHHSVDPGFAKGARFAWHWQSSSNSGAAGGGGASRQPAPSHVGQRLCKFYGSGYCRRGASCKYLHLD